MTTQNDVELRWVFNAILRRFWVIIVCAVLVALLAALAAYSLPLTYSASVKLVVEPSKDSRSNEYDTLAAAERLAFTYSQMMKNTTVLQTVIGKMGLSGTPEALAKRITAEPIKDTHMILLTAEDASPEKAAALVNTLAEVFIQYNQNLQMERYSSSLSDNQKKMDDFQALLAQAQAQIDALTTQRSDNEIQLSALKEQQIETKADYRALQQNQAAVQIQAQQLENHVTIAEAALPAMDSRLSRSSIVTATLLVNQNPVVEGSDYSAILAGQSLASTYSQVVVSRPVVEAALAQVRSQQTYEDVIGRLSARAVPNTLLIKLMMSGPNSGETAKLVNGIAQEFIQQTKAKYQKVYDDKLAGFESQMQAQLTLIQQTEAQISTLSSSIAQAGIEISRQENLISGYQNDIRSLEQNEERIRLEMVQAVDSISLVESANPPKKPVQNRMLTVAIAGVVGGMLGVAFVFVLQYMNNKIQTTEEVGALLGLNVLGTIGRRTRAEPELLTETQFYTPLAEQFSVLATRIQHALRSGPAHSLLLVSSPTASEGKSFICANLALALANTGLHIALIDADLRKPRIHQLFGLKESTGLADVMYRKASEIGFTSAGGGNLQVLAGGSECDNPSQVLNSPQLANFFQTIKQNVDLVIVDCPPILPVADTQILSVHADEFLMVVRSGKTFIRAAQEARIILEQTGVKLLGGVLNDIPQRSDHSYYYRYYSNESKPKKRTLPGLVGTRAGELFQSGLKKIPRR